MSVNVKCCEKCFWQGREICNQCDEYSEYDEAKDCTDCAESFFCDKVK